MNNEKFDKEIKQTFSHNLNKWLAAKDKDVEWLAKLCGVSIASAYYWLSAIKIPRMDKIKLIATELDIKISDLLDEHPDDVPTLTNQQLKAVIFGTSDISDESLCDVLKYAQYVKERGIKNE